MEERPKIIPALEPIDRILNYIGLGLLAFSWIYVIYYYPKLPDTIPTHFDHTGAVNGHGNKLTLFILPIIGTIIYAGVGSLNRIPYIFNYAVKITPENAERQYKIANRTMRYIKTTIQLVLAVIIFKTVANALGNEEGLGKWFLPGFLLIIFLPLVVMYLTAIKSKN